MKFFKYKNITYLLILSIALTFSTVACSPKAGCPASENATVKADRKGRLPTKGGKSQLFSPKGPQSMKKAQKARKKQRKRIYSKRKS